MPFSKSTQFGTEDIHELASLLAENPGKLCRLPKAKAMFASRACRSSVMIGKALNAEQMTKLIRNMTGLEQPWNCPHG
jgi:DNA mismatch repair protein PMS2